MKALLGWSLACVFALALAPSVLAGGSGLNVVIVVNQQSTNSIQLGNYYREQRQVPPQNVLRINWTGGNIQWTTSDFNTYLFNPLMGLLVANQLTNQIDYIVLSMDIPYRVTDSSSVAVNSTTSTLFYGFKPDPNLACSMAPGSTNLYAGTEGIFRLTPPISASSNSFLVTMITSSNLVYAEQIVDQGVSSDATFPTQTVYLVKGPDVDRNVRYLTFDNAIFNTRLRGNYSMVRTNVSSYVGFPNILGYQFGAVSIDMTGYAFLPGSLVDNLTSYGGLLFQDSGQLDILALARAGAAGTYGTVDEPCNYLEKFPSPQDYFYQARGFSLAECYYMSLTNPYQGLIIGEPLAAPFAQPASGSWSGLPTNALLTAVTNLGVQFAASGARHPVQQVDLFVDGLWQQTLTNIAPGRSNFLQLVVNSQTFNYLVPQGATIKAVTSDLTGLLNNGSNSTHIVALAQGDRIELRSFDRSKTGSQIGLAVSNSVGTGTALTTYLTASRPTFLDTVAYGLRGWIVAGTPVAGTVLQVTVTKTNGTPVTVAVTNTTGNLTLTQMAQQLLSAVNANSLLNGPDGLTGQDLITDYAGPSPPPQVEFNFQANAPGWNAAEIQVSVLAQGGPVVSPSVPAALDQNLPDLEPRNHVYVTAGVTNLPVSFFFNTTTQADGFHELTAVVYEGSHVRTEQRRAQSIVCSNSPLAATLTTLVGGSNTAVEATLQFLVVANTNNISRIELFSTGGSLGNVLNQSSATFSVAGSYLGIGLHPFYAVVTANSGRQYRTATTWLRIIGADSAFRLTLSTPPPTLTWPATAGRSYDILSTTNLSFAFQTNTSVVPSNTLGTWVDTNPPAANRFYRVRTSQ